MGLEQHAELSCQELVELVTEYLEGGMNRAERAVFEAHVERCVGCQHHLAQMQHTIRLLGHLDAATLSAEQRTAMQEAFQGWTTNARIE